MTVKELIKLLKEVKNKEATVWYKYSNGRNVMCPMNEVIEKEGYIYLNLKER